MRRVWIGMSEVYFTQSVEEAQHCLRGGRSATIDLLFFAFQGMVFSCGFPPLAVCDVSELTDDSRQVHATTPLYADTGT